MDITKEELASIVSDVVTQCFAERRKEIAETPHHCFCSDPTDRRHHEEEHEALRRVIKMFDNWEKTRWKVFLIIAAVLSTALCYAVWDGIKISLRK